VYIALSFSLGFAIALFQSSYYYYYYYYYYNEEIRNHVLRALIVNSVSALKSLSNITKPNLKWAIIEQTAIEQYTRIPKLYQQLHLV